MFEFGVCNRCSAEFLIGDRTNPDEDGHLAVRQAPAQRRNLMYLLLADQIDNDDEDEAAVVDDAEVEADVDRRRLCTACGSLAESANEPCKLRGNRRVAHRHVRQTKERPAAASMPGLLRPHKQ